MVQGIEPVAMRFQLGAMVPLQEAICNLHNATQDAARLAGMACGGSAHTSLRSITEEMYLNDQ